MDLCGIQGNIIKKNENEKIRIFVTCIISHGASVYVYFLRKGHCADYRRGARHVVCFH